MSHASGEIHTRQCCAPFFATFRCHCHTPHRRLVVVIGFTK